MADISKLLMGGGPASPSDGSDDSGGADGSSELDAAKDLLAAIKRGDAGAVNLALKRHYEACQASDEPDEDDYEES